MTTTTNPSQLEEQEDKDAITLVSEYYGYGDDAAQNEPSSAATTTNTSTTTSEHTDESLPGQPSRTAPLSHSMTPGMNFPARPPRRAGMKGLRKVSTDQGDLHKSTQAMVSTTPKKHKLHQKNTSNGNNNNNNNGSFSSHSTTTTSTNNDQPDTGVVMTPTTHDFAVRSIRRGTQEWNDLVKPFVADLAYESATSRYFGRGQHFRPFTCTAAVMFVDISGYSKIASALADRGAHALSTAVNSYLRRILRVVKRHAGDIIKFAGDAVLCVWYCKEYGDDVQDSQRGGSNNSQNTSAFVNGYATAGSSNTATSTSGDDDPHNVFRQHVLAAALCAQALQDECGVHEIDTGHKFRIHIGLTCGTIESEIFVAPTAKHMQRLFHLVGGEALEEIGDLVDLAKATETCISAGIIHHLRTLKATTHPELQFTLEPVENYVKETWSSDSEDDEEGGGIPAACKGDPQLLTSLTVDEATRHDVDYFVEDTLIERMEKRNKSMEEDFIHPSVLELLSHGGMSPTQIAQMRDLVVLFIAQTSHGAPINWLMEVQSILDKNQCPLIQIVADDKGVHAIAAVNAVAAVPESRLLGLEICRALVDQKIGVAIGMAAGSTFCGVTGSSTHGCRWDLTGTAVVRAARLMQYSLAKKVPMAIDQSLYAGSTLPARLTLLQDDVSIKGSPDPVKIYTMSEATIFSAMNLLETVHGEIHEEQVQAITKHITGSRHRSAIVVTGPTLSGKKIVCQRAAGYADMVPFLHVSDSSYGMLQLVRTVAKWFKYVEEEKVHKKAWSVLQLMQQNLLSRAHDECLSLVDLALDYQLSACFIVDRCEFLDEFSISFMRECLHGRKYRLALAQTTAKVGLGRPGLIDSNSQASFNAGNSGRIAFLCVHVPLYNSPTAKSFADDVTRSHRRLSVPVIEVAEASIDQFKGLTETMSGARFENRILYAGVHAAGGCAGYFIERVAHIGQAQAMRAKEGKKPLVLLRKDITYCVPPGSLREFRTIPVMKVGPEIAMRYGHSYDELPPICQIFCKVLAVVSQNGYYWVPRDRVWEVMNDLIAEGVANDTMGILLKEMSDLYLIRTWFDEGVEYVKFQSPALADIALDVCTPDQLQNIAKAWIGRLTPDIERDFRVKLVMAWLHHMIDPCAKCSYQTSSSIKYWKQGYSDMLKKSEEEQWGEEKLERWNELIASEIEAGHKDPRKILGPEFDYDQTCPDQVGMSFMQIFMYRAPIAFGPLGNTASVLGNMIVKEVKFFDDPSENLAAIQRFKASACARYLKERALLEDYLSEFDLQTSEDDLSDEAVVVDKLMQPARDRDEAIQHGVVFMNELMGNFGANRLEKLRDLVTNHLDSKPVPSFVTDCPHSAIPTAYQIMFGQYACMTQANEVDSAQHALMVLATRGWQPRPTPEPMKHLLRQSVARIRNNVVRKLSEGQKFYQRHQQSSVDLKAFLLTTALLFHAQDTGKYKVEVDS